MSVKLSPDSIVQGTTDGQSIRNKFTRIVYIVLEKVHIYDAGGDIMMKIMMRIRRVSLIRLPGKGIPGPRFPWDSQSLSPIHPNINISLFQIRNFRLMA